MTEDNPLLLRKVYAEIDKNGNRDFHRENPDFVFHEPGTHACNTLVVEVKPCIDDTDGIKKDFGTLSKFIENHGYRAGAFVLFGHSFAALMRARGQEISEASRESIADRIYLLTIESAHAECEEHVLSSACAG